MHTPFLRRALRRAFGAEDRARLRAVLVNLMAHYDGPTMQTQDYRVYRAVLKALED